MSTARKYDDVELPEGWRTVRLDAIADVIGGSTPSRDRDEFWGGSIPWVVPSEITSLSGRCLTYTNECITEAGLQAAGLKILPVGSVLLTSRATIGAAAINTRPVATNQGFQNLVAKDGTNSVWLYYCISSMRRELDRRAAGSTFAEISRDNVRSLPILYPPLPEQRAIADVLDSIDVAIERTEAVIAATETLRDALLHELLTRGVPGWHTEWKDVPGIGTIPADWEVVRLGDGVVHVGSGVTPRGGKSVYTPSGITFLRSQNVHFDGLRLEDVVRIPPETDKAMARSRVQPNDVLLNITGASIGRCTVVPSDFGPANVNQHVCIIRTSDQFNPQYVWKWLSTPRSQKEIDDIQTGQSRQGLNYQQVRQLSIALPPRSEQDAFVEILSGLDATIAEAKRERHGLRSLKMSTADALLMGRAQVQN